MNALNGVQISEGQLGIDHFNIGQGIYMVGHVDHVVVFKTAHDMGDGIRLANVGEKLVTQSLALARTATVRQCRQIPWWSQYLFRLDQLSQLVLAGSGTGTTPALGSMVQNGKFSASIPALVSALIELIFQRWQPTIPHLNPMLFPMAYGH